MTMYTQLGKAYNQEPMLFSAVQMGVYIIGKGIILPGDMLHGSAIPESYVKVSLLSVVYGIKPLLKTSFDDDSDELSQGQIIGWPIDNVHMQ